MARPRGIEPRSVAPEAAILSVELRARELGRLAYGRGIVPAFGLLVWSSMMRIRSLGENRVIGGLRDFTERRPRTAEGLVCLALLVFTTLGSAWFLIQHVPSIGYAYRFSTVHFVPAALYASGAGYVNPPADQVAGMRDFLDERVDTFVWQGDVPEMEGTGLTWFHRGSAYLLWTVGWAWSVFGVSWTVFRFVIALMAGALVVVCYGLGRLFAPRWASALVALLFMTTPAVLTVMPNIRDFAKAPFILGAFGVMLWLVLRPVRGRQLLGVAAGLGAVIGIGIGFRPDVLVCLPPAVIMVMLTQYESTERSWRFRAAAPLVVLAAFFVASGPMRLTDVGRDSGGVAHDIVTGMSTESETFLGVHSPSYERVYYFWDAYTHAIGNSYGHRVMGIEGPIEYQSEAADAALSAYMFRTMWHFPGDMLARGYAATLRILGSGFARVEEYRHDHTLYGYPDNG